MQFDNDVVFFIQSPEPVLKSNWRLYGTELLNFGKCEVNWEIHDFSVQSFWNSSDIKLLDVIDKTIRF